MLDYIHYMALNGIEISLWYDRYNDSVVHLRPGYQRRFVALLYLCKPLVLHRIVIQYL